MTAMFEFVGGGIGVMPDPGDNPDTHVVPHHAAGTQISFQVANVGDDDGTADVEVDVDDEFATSWRSGVLSPGQQQVGFVSLGRLGQGAHSVQTIVNPGSGTADNETNTFDIG
jgi:hypothetical protein